jgi:hypothetical protein
MTAPTVMVRKDARVITGVDEVGARCPWSLPDVTVPRLPTCAATYTGAGRVCKGPPPVARLPVRRMVSIPCLRPFATSHQFMGYALMNPTSNAIDITNQNAGALGPAVGASTALRIIIGGIIPVMRRFIESSSGTNVLPSARL